MAKAFKIRHIAPEDQVSHVLNKIVLVRILEIRKYRAVVLRNPSPDAVHDFRVAVRRLFSLLKVFHRYIPADSYDYIRRVLKDLLDLFCHVREIDVFQVMLAGSSLARKYRRQSFVRGIMDDKRSARNEFAVRSLEYLRKLDDTRCWRRLESELFTR